jgi:phosphate-selective porin OprO and OprP
VYGAALGGRADHILHFGASTRYREADDTRFGYGEDAYSFALGKIVKTSAIADSDVFLGLEAAYQNGGFSLQGEASRTFVDCASAYCAGGDPTFDAAYIDASYVFGGHRTYSPHGGKFGRYAIDHPVGEAGGLGAFELAARLDYVDLIDNGVLGGQQTTSLLGATYHANQNLRFQLNYADSDIEAPTSGLSSDVEAVTVRMQVDLTARH